MLRPAAAKPPEALKGAVAVRFRAMSEGTVAVTRRRGKYDIDFLQTVHLAQRQGALAFEAPSMEFE